MYYVFEKSTVTYLPAKKVLTGYVGNLFLGSVFSLGQGVADETDFPCCFVIFWGQWLSLGWSEFPWDVLCGSRRQLVAYIPA